MIRLALTIIGLIFAAGIVLGVLLALWLTLPGSP